MGLKKQHPPTVDGAPDWQSRTYSPLPTVSAWASFPCFSINPSKKGTSFLCKMLDTCT